MPLFPSRSLMLSTTTAKPCGTSKCSRRRSFSLIISDAKTRSGWSVTMSSPKKCGPGMASFSNSATRSRTPLPSAAETGTTALKAYSFETPAICSIKAVLSLSRSILFITKTAGMPEALNFSIKSSAAAETSRPASMTRAHASTLDTDSLTDFTIYSPKRFFGFKSPGVSIKTSCVSPSVSTPVMRVRVVCGFEETIATFLGSIAFKSDDFPTLGLPTMAINAVFPFSDKMISPFHLFLLLCTKSLMPRGPIII